MQQRAERKDGAPMVVDVLEASRLLSLSIHTVRSFIRRGVIPSIKLGRRVLVPVASLQRITKGN
jgi:excisionase family DNA binding protein